MIYVLLVFQFHTFKTMAECFLNAPYEYKTTISQVQNIELVTQWLNMYIATIFTLLYKRIQTNVLSCIFDQEFYRNTIYILYSNMQTHFLNFVITIIVTTHQFSITNLTQGKITLENRISLCSILPYASIFKLCNYNNCHCTLILHISIPTQSISHQSSTTYYRTKKN